MLTDYYFWFSQPSSILNKYDWASGWLFAALLVLGLLMFGIHKMFIKHAVTKKLISKFSTLFFWEGVLGLIWFGFRYESVPIFSRRYWLGIVLLIGLVWLLFNVWYLIVNFSKEKQDYDFTLLKNKYIK